MLRLVLISALVALATARVPKIKPLVPMYDGRIVGGTPTTIEDLPHQLSLQGYSLHICGASILTPTAALTAAHCTDGVSSSLLSVRAGSSTRGSGGSVHQVSSICQHPRFDYWTIDYNVSVLRLSSAISLGSTAQTIGLAASQPSVGTLATVSGWGDLSSGGSSPLQLQRVEVPTISREQCKGQYGSSSITDRMICAGYVEGGKDSCQGDSGGPLIVEGSSPQQSAQIGVVSWGAGCASPNYAGVYADVTESSIRSHVEKCVA